MSAERAVFTEENLKNMSSQEIFKEMKIRWENHDALVEACREANIVLSAVEELYPDRFCKFALELTEKVLAKIEEEK